MIKHFMTLLNQEPSLYAEVGEAAFGLGRHNLSSFGGSYRSGGKILSYIYFYILFLYLNFLYFYDRYDERACPVRHNHPGYEQQDENFGM